jgi:cation transport ATPase
MAVTAPVHSRIDDSEGPSPATAQRPPKSAAPPRVLVDGGRLLLRSPDLFSGDDSHARRLIDHAFTLAEVRSVVLRRERGQITIDLAPLANPDGVWRRLGALLRQGERTDTPAGRAARLDLAGPAPALPVRIARAGNVLTTFRARLLSQQHLRIGHPLLRQHDVRSRFEDFLRSVHGVTDVRLGGFLSSALVIYDPSQLEAEQLLSLLEGAWPDLLGGPPVALPPRKLFVAGALLGFSYAAQYFNPALLPWATAAMALYSLPNLIAAIRDLARGRVGLPALYSAGLVFLIWVRLPFASSVLATLTQLWPALANRLASHSERSLFAEHRRRLTWARPSDGEQGETIVGVEDLRPGAAVIVRAGDYLPADGVVVEGHAAVDEDMLTGARGAADKISGDLVFAGTFVRDGALTLRVERLGAATAAAAMAHILPHGRLSGLPSSVVAERIANRNAKPAIFAAALLLLATRTPRLSQVVIRPDYATAPRLSAHLSALTALVESLARGALIRHPAVLDRLLAVEVFIFDDGLDFSARTVEIAKINVVTRAAAGEALALAAAALAGRDDPRARAVQRELDEDGGARPPAHGRRQRAGETTFWDEDGALVSVASPEHALHESFAAPSGAIHNLVHKLALDPIAAPSLRPLVVARDRKILGVIQFAADGALRYAELIAALRAKNPEARFVHISSGRQEQAEARSEGLGFDAVFGGLDPQAKMETLRSLGMRAAWIGDGADPDTASVRAASFVSISLAGLDGLPIDKADVVLLRDDLHALLALRDAAETHFWRLKSDYRTVYLANLLAITGGFTAGFGSLQAGLTSNLGSAAVFLGCWRGLVNLSVRAERIAESRRGASKALAGPPAGKGLALRRQGRLAPEKRDR